MTRTSDASRLRRLDMLSSRLKAEEPMAIGALADEFGVSRRTLTRDIALLRDRGLPVDADRAAAAGFAWPRPGVWGGSISTIARLDLLVSLAVAEQTRSPILMANLAPIRRKLMASFSANSRNRINQLKARILIGGPASASVISTYVPPKPRVVEALHKAFLTMQVAQITYSDGEGRISKRVIEPQYLLLNYPVWYVLAYDPGRQAIRTFRCDRLQAVQPLGETFRLRGVADFRIGLEGLDIDVP